MIGDRAGLAPGMKVIGVNSKTFSRQRLLDALADSVALRKIELLLLEGEEFRTVVLDYADGPRYLELVRDDRSRTPRRDPQASPADPSQAPTRARTRPAALHGRSRCRRCATTRRRSGQTCGNRVAAVRRHVAARRPASVAATAPKDTSATAPADPDRRPARRRRLETGPLDRRVRRHRGRRPPAAPVPDPGQDALGRHVLLRRRPARGAARLGHAHQARLGHLPGQRLRDLHRPRRRQPRVLRDRDQRPQYRVGPVPQEALSRRRPGDQRVGDPRPEDGRPRRRHAQQPERHRHSPGRSSSRFPGRCSPSTPTAPRRRATATSGGSTSPGSSGSTRSWTASTARCRTLAEDNWVWSPQGVDRHAPPRALGLRPVLDRAAGPGGLPARPGRTDPRSARCRSTTPRRPTSNRTNAGRRRCAT